MSEDIGILTLHKLNVILCEFKWSFLEIHIARTARKHKTEVNMNNMPLGIYKDVIIMPIFYLEKVLNDGVPC